MFELDDCPYARTPRRGGGKNYMASIPIMRNSQRLSLVLSVGERICSKHETHSRRATEDRVDHGTSVLDLLQVDNVKFSQAPSGPTRPCCYYNTPNSAQNLPHCNLSISSAPALCSESSFTWPCRVTYLTLARMLHCACFYGRATPPTRSSKSMHGRWHPAT